MRTFLRFISVLILLSCFVCEAHAAKRYWVAANDSIWNSTRNWSATSGGAFGASVPGSNDTAYFDGGSVKKDTFDINVSVKRLEIANTYTGTIIQGAKTLTIGTSGAVLSGGTFSGGSASITVSGAFTISGCTFTSTSGTFSTSANFTFSSGSFTHNSGKMKFTASCTITGTITMYQLEFAPATSSTYTIASGTTITVDNTLTTSGSSVITLNTGNISAHGNATINNTYTAGTGGTATITFNGSGTQTLTGSGTAGAGRLPNVVINKSSTDTLNLVGGIAVSGNWTYTSGVINAGSSLVYFRELSSKTITGSHALNDVSFTSYGSALTCTVASGTTLTVNGFLRYEGTHDITISTGTIAAKGDIMLTSTSSGGGGSGKILINGTSGQTFTGQSIAGNSRTCNVEINKSSGTLSLASVISVAGNWTYTAGTISPGASTVYFIGTKKITSTGTDALGDVTFDGSATSTYTIATGSTLKTSGTLLINGTAVVKLDSGDVYSAGNITVSNTATTASGSARIIINGTGNQTLTGSGTAGQGRLPKITIDKTSGVLTLASVISVYGDWIYTKGSVAEGTSSVALYGTSNLDGQLSGGTSLMRFYSLAVSADTRTLTGNIDVNKNFTIASGATLSAGSNSIYLAGNWNSQGTWTYGTGTVIFDSTGFKQITGASGTQVNFYNITFNKYYSTTSPSSITLARPLKINHTATFTQGHIKSTTTNYFEFALGATLSGGNDSAYVHGPVRKTGNDAFTFPLGDTTLVDTAYHPLAMTAPSSTSDQFEATYFAIAQTYGDSLVDSLAAISDCEYWTLDRKVGSSTPTVSASWNKNSCNVDDYDDLRLAQWNGVKWLDLGASSITVSDVRGTLTGAITPGYSLNPVPIVISKKYAADPYAILLPQINGGYHTVYNGKLLFKFDETYNESGRLTYNIYDDYSRLVASSTTTTSTALHPLTVQQGDNRYMLNLLDCTISSTGNLGSGYYLLEVINDKNEKRYLLIKHIKTITTDCSNDVNPG